MKEQKKYSLAYLTIPGTHPVDQIEIAESCGYDGVSLRTISMQLPGEPDYHLAGTDTLKEVKSALRRTGLRCFDVELGRVGDGLDVRSYEPELAAAQELGAEYVISSFWTADRTFAIQQEQQLCDLAAKYNMKVNLEFMSFSELPDLQEALQVVSAVDRSNLRILVDLLHIYRAKNSPEELSEVPAGLLGFAHLCDGPAEIPPVDSPEMKRVAREDRYYMGDGGIDCAAYLAAMPELPYYSIELPNLKHMERYGKRGHAKRCIEAAKRICG